MATAPQPQGSSPNAAVVIRERIKQKRLFEAQFLFGLLDEDDVSPQERLVLERELNGLLAVVRDLQIQANKYLAEGEYHLARKMHKEMERIAVDVPGLEEGKRRAATPPEPAAPMPEAVRETPPIPEAVRETEPMPEPALPDEPDLPEEPALPDLVDDPPQTQAPPPPAPESELDDILSPLDDVPDVTPRTTEPETPAETETPDAAEAAPEPAKPKKQTGSPKKKLWLAAAILLLALLGFLLMKNAGQDSPPAAPVAKPGEQAEVAIKPLSVRQSDDAQKPAEGQPAGAEEAQSGTITIGELKVEE